MIYRKVKGTEYAYLERSIRINNKIRKISKYLGPKDKLTKKIIEKQTALFEEEYIKNKSKMITKWLKLEYPLAIEDIETIEQMKDKYDNIIKNLHTKDVEDLNKRFIANYVFETNALEGNSLTLKNVAEIVFEKRIAKGKDLREIYDAQNSYNLFLYLQKINTRISHEFIIKIHSMLIDKIDDRTGYRTVPVIILGRPDSLLPGPSKVHQEMDLLLKWYYENEKKMYPLELAFKFHAKFEKIHPFCDGNGRVGRFLLNYILMQKGYFPVIIRRINREAYLRALEAADNKSWIVIMRFAIKHYKETFRKFFEIYAKHAVNLSN